jgi:hypothetical protein
VTVRCLTTMPVSKSKHTEPWRIPLGPSANHGCVRGRMVFVVSASSLASMYAPKLTRQCLAKSIFSCLTISRGENSTDIPFLAGVAFSHMTTKVIRCIITFFGRIIFLGNAATVHRARSFIVLMSRSMSLTCSLAAVVLT